MRDTLGGKGAGLAEMTRAGLPVPPGFTISTDVCCALLQAKKGKIPSAVDTEIAANVKKLEKVRRRRHARLHAGTRCSCPCGRASKFSMPGHDGHHPQPRAQRQAAVEGLKARTSNGRFALDSYRRFIQMFGNVVLEIPEGVHSSTSSRRSRSARRERPRTPILARRRCVRSCSATSRWCATSRARRDFPQDPQEQLKMSRDAVFRSWMNPRAQEYRRIYDIPDHIGTAVNVQVMVFGNMRATGRATGVGFTRNPGDRRQGVLRRVSDRRAGRGRCRRHPHAATH